MKIAIVGAGLTGCLLANSLVEKGYDVTVFEKSRGAGGRCTHKRTSWGSFDMGAPFIPTTDADFQQFMQQQVASGNATLWPAESYQYTENNVIRKANQQSFVFSPTMHSLCKSMLNGSHLVTQFRVRNIQKQQKCWRLIEQSGQVSATFDYVIVCAPWPQTNALLGSQSCLVVPKLLHQQWTSCWTVALQFEQAIETPYQYIHCKDSILQTLVNDSAKPQRSQTHSVWVAYFDNKASDQYCAAEKSQIRELALTEMEKILAVPLPKVLNNYEHYWRFARPKQNEKSLGIVGDLTTGLLAAGDWSEGASVQSCYLTAMRLSNLFASIP